MTTVIARHIFNPFFEIRCGEYFKAYETIIRQKALIKNAQGITFEENQKNLLEIYYDKIKQDPPLERVEIVMEMVQHDFKDDTRRALLKTRNEQLFINSEIYSKCTFVGHLRLRYLWKYKGPDALTNQDKTQIWDMLQGLWLLAQSALLLPPEVLKKMESLAMENATLIHENSEPEDVTRVVNETKSILYQVKGMHFKLLLGWMKRLMMERNTPVFDLLPTDYVNTVRNVQDVVLDDDYKNVFMNAFTSPLAAFKNAAKEKGLKILPNTEEEMKRSNSVMDEEDLESLAILEDHYDYDKQTLPDRFLVESKSSDPSSSSSATPDEEEQDTQSQQLVDLVVDTLFKIIQKNKEKLKGLKNDPKALMRNLLNIGQLKEIGDQLSSDIKEVSSTKISVAPKNQALKKTN